MKLVVSFAHNSSLTWTVPRPTHSDSRTTILRWSCTPLAPLPPHTPLSTIGVLWTYYITALPAPMPSVPVPRPLLQSPCPLLQSPSPLLQSPCHLLQSPCPLLYRVEACSLCPYLFNITANGRGRVYHFVHQAEYACVCTCVYV